MVASYVLVVYEPGLFNLSMLALPTPLWLQRLTFVFPCLSLSVTQTHRNTNTPQSNTSSLCDMLHAPRDPLLISNPWHHNQKLISGLQSRTVHRGLAPQSCYAWASKLSHWSAFPHSQVLSCLLRLSESTSENITHRRGGGDKKKKSLTLTKK